jgi:hypothetical protein
MDWLSGVVGLGGVMVALLALLLTYRSRLAPYQQQLYERQLDAATEVLQALGRYHDESLSVVDGGVSGLPAGADGGVSLSDARTQFFRTYRRWNVVIPQPVTEAVTVYLQTIEQLVTKVRNGELHNGPSQTSAGEQLATAYASVLGVAQRELRVRRLSDKTLSSIESLSGQSAEPAFPADPLYIKAVAEQRLFENFSDDRPVSSETPGPVHADRTIEAIRNRQYVENRNLFLVHAWRPSTKPNQLADISIRVVEHVRRGSGLRADQASADRPITDGLIENVEYYLGASFRRSFTRTDVATGFRLDVSAFGPTLCVASVSFTDGTPPVTLFRYLDFIVPEATGSH